MERDRSENLAFIGSNLTRKVRGYDVDGAHPAVVNAMQDVHDFTEGIIKTTYSDHRAQVVIGNGPKLVGRPTRAGEEMTDQDIAANNEDYEPFKKLDPDCVLTEEELKQLDHLDDPRSETQIIVKRLVAEYKKQSEFRKLPPVDRAIIRELMQYEREDKHASSKFEVILNYYIGMFSVRNVAPERQAEIAKKVAKLIDEKRTIDSNVLKEEVPDFSIEPSTLAEREGESYVRNPILVEYIDAIQDKVHRMRMAWSDRVLVSAASLARKKGDSKVNLDPVEVEERPSGLIGL